jgi:hypothetical protein
MASAEPLLSGGSKPKAKHTKFSIVYGADEYLEHLAKKYEEYDELAALLQASPDGGHDLTRRRPRRPRQMPRQAAC